MSDKLPSGPPRNLQEVLEQNRALVEAAPKGVRAIYKMNRETEGSMLLTLRPERWYKVTAKNVRLARLHERWLIRFARTGRWEAAASFRTDAERAWVRALTAMLKALR